MSSRTFVIGDVHGCAKTLQQLVFRVLSLKHSDRLYFLGDLIDRGPKSKEVLDLIMRLQAASYAVRSIRGNHEEMLLGSITDRHTLQIWLDNGGDETLASFGVNASAEIPLPYRTFLHNLPCVIELERFVLCHAGINCAAADPYADREALLWSRDLPVIPSRIGNRRIICGHTVHSLSEIEASLTTDRICLDGGCVYHDRPGLGNLVALEIGSMTLYHTVNIDVPHAAP